ncbi:PadR family transcriptional regulator [candidate division KSB1 bacterium]
MRILTFKEEIILAAVWKLGGSAHGVPIREKVIEMSRKDIVYGTLYNSLEYLIQKGYIISEKGDPTPERGGKSKTVYTITAQGKKALKDTRELHDSIWLDMPDLKPGLK